MVSTAHHVGSTQIRPEWANSRPPRPGIALPPPDRALLPGGEDLPDEVAPTAPAEATGAVVRVHPHRDRLMGEAFDHPAMLSNICSNSYRGSRSGPRSTLPGVSGDLPVLVVTTTAAWPDALAAQRRLLNRHLRDAYRFLVVVNTPVEPSQSNLWDRTMRDRTIAMAHETADEVIVVPPEVHQDRRTLFPRTIARRAADTNATLMHADALQYTWNTRLRGCGTAAMILDSDMFPIRDFSIREQLGANILIGLPQHRRRRFPPREVTYLWSGLALFDFARMPHQDHWSYDVGFVAGIRLDGGGQTARWLDRLTPPERAQVDTMRSFHSGAWTAQDLPADLPEPVRDFILTDDRNRAGTLYCEYFLDCLLHYRGGGSNWQNEEAAIVTARQQRLLAALQ